MYKKLCLFVIFFCGYAIAQSSEMAFSNVITVENAQKSVLITRAKMFLESKKYDIKVEGDAVKGKGKFVVEYPSVVKGKTEKGEVYFNIAVMCKDGRYKYEINDFKHLGINGRASGGSLNLSDPECGKAQIALSSWNKIKSDTNENVKKLIDELQKNMIEISNNPDKDNW
jgi:hypothetical protein